MAENTPANTVDLSEVREAGDNIKANSFSWHGCQSSVKHCSSVILHRTYTAY